MRQDNFPAHIPDTGSLLKLVARLTEEYPDYCTVTTAAKLLGVTKSTVIKYHTKHIETIEVEGITLYKIDSVRHRARMRKGPQGGASVIRLTGIDVERIRQICETYYRKEYDIAPAHLLALAKRVARL